jgi:hypothetical protein
MGRFSFQFANFSVLCLKTLKANKSGYFAILRIARFQCRGALVKLRSLSTLPKWPSVEHAVSRHYQQPAIIQHHAGLTFNLKSEFLGKKKREMVKTKAKDRVRKKERERE